MKLNVANWDRVARVVIGIILFALGLTGVVSGVLMWVVYVLGLVMFATAAMGFCPLYLPFNFSTRK
jgi:hypothetical protein